MLRKFGWEVSTFCQLWIYIYPCSIPSSCCNTIPSRCPAPTESSPTIKPTDWISQFVIKVKSTFFSNGCKAQLTGLNFKIMLKHLNFFSHYEILPDTDLMQQSVSQKSQTKAYK